MSTQPLRDRYLRDGFVFPFDAMSAAEAFERDVDAVVTASRILVTRVPGNDVTAVLEGRCRGVRLCIVCSCIDPILTTDRLTEDIIVLAVDVGTGLVIPGDDIIALTITGNLWIVLMGARIGIDPVLAAITYRNRQLGAVTEVHRLDIN